MMVCFSEAIWGRKGIDPFLLLRVEGMSSKETPSAPASKVWSCSTLDCGVQHVGLASLPDDEEQLQAMLQEPIVETLLMSKY